MRPLFFILILISLLLSRKIIAQNPGKISGNITSNAPGKPIPINATVTLMKFPDSSVVGVITSKIDGSYSFTNVGDGKYLLSASAVGHLKGYSGRIEISALKNSHLVPAIQLKHLTHLLQTVTVSSRKQLIEHKIDRTVINVEAAATNVGSNALEILEKSPGVIVDKDGNIGLKGKEGVLVMIDGRASQLSGQDLASFLRNMSSNQLDQIEIMTNPPARYDASGNAGIINIKTKKIQTAGYNGSMNLSYSQGRYPKTAEGFNLNARKNKVNLFANASHNFSENYEILSIQRNIGNPNSNVIENYFDQEANKLATSKSISGKVGFDYYIDKKTTMGAFISGYSSTHEMRNENQTNIFTNTKDLQSITKASVFNEQEWKSINANLNMRKVFDSAGRELSAELDYITYRSQSDQFMINIFGDVNASPLFIADSLQGSLPQNLTIYSGRLDYLYPLRKGAKFEVGIKTSIVQTDNDARYDSIQNGSMIHDFARSNHFLYEEIINAAYMNLNKNISAKFSAQVGLRLEHTLSKGTQLTNGESFSRDYTQLFPTAYFQYKANKSNNFSVNYGRRIRRPNYGSLNPFIRFIDRYTYSQGNPDLKPQFSNNIELSHSYKNFLNTTINFSSTNDIIQNTVEQRGPDVYTKQANIASMRQIGLAVSANHQLTKWWSNNIYINIFNNAYEGVVNKTFVKVAATTITLNGTQQFKISKTLTGEITGFYRSSGIQGVMEMRSIGTLAVGMSKQILKNQGSLRLTIRDILYTQRARAIVKYGNVDVNFQEERDSRVISVGFTYRFNKGKTNNTKKARTGSADEEQNRVGIN